MIAPEKWRSDESLSRAENVARRSLPLALGHDPVLDAYAARARIGPARDIAGCKDSGHICFQKFVDQYAVVGRDSCCFSKRYVWAHADPHNDQVAIQSCPVIELHISVLYKRWRPPEIKFYAVRVVSFTNQV